MICRRSSATKIFADGFVKMYAAEHWRMHIFLKDLRKAVSIQWRVS